MRTSVRATTSGTISSVNPRLAITIACLFFLPLVSAGCSDDEPELTQAELLAEIEGHELTPAEVAEREEVAALLCSLDDQILLDIWSKLEPSELAFQDFVFGRFCEERSSLYGEATGRFAVEASPDS